MTFFERSAMLFVALAWPATAAPQRLEVDLEPDFRSNFYRMNLSESPKNPLVWKGEPHEGLDTLSVYGGGTHDASALDFSFTGSYDVVALVPSKGVLNLGSPQEPYLVHDPPWAWGVLPTLVASVVVDDPDGNGADLLPHGIQHKWTTLLTAQGSVWTHVVQRDGLARLLDDC